MSTMEIEHGAELNSVRNVHRLNPFESFLQLPTVWLRRAVQRRQLRELLMQEDRLLFDVGLDRMDVRREARKPFWKA